MIGLAKEINVNKSLAIDGISSEILKDTFLALSNHLTYIFNSSIQYNSFPDSWKIATVIPIPKEGNPLDVHNYRPLSLLPLPGELLEKIVYKQIITHLDANKTLDPNQSGFRANHSTGATVAELTDDICININNNKHTIATYIDLKKAVTYMLKNDRKWTCRSVYAGPTKTNMYTSRSPIRPNRRKKG